MDSNKSIPVAGAARLAVCLAALLLAGCSVTGQRESPINDVTRGSPTVLEVYRGQASGAEDASRAATSPQRRLRSASGARPIAAGDEDTRRYWSALQPMRQRFARVPNPDLVMVVYPHLARGKYPVPGYVTVFPMYEQTFYALPGEVAEDLIAGQGLQQREREQGGPAPQRAGRRVEPVQFYN